MQVRSGCAYGALKGRLLWQLVVDCSIDRVGSFTLIALPPTTLMEGLLMEVPVTPAIDTPLLTLQPLQDFPDPALLLAMAVQQLGWVIRQAMHRLCWRRFALRLHPSAYQKVIEQRRRDSFRLPQPYQLHCSCSQVARSTCGFIVTRMASPSFCCCACP